MSKLHGVWRQMKRRCTDAAWPGFYRYGGRGIKVCGEWKDRLKFVKWAQANGWKPGLQIDRIDNDGDYSPENCRFITCRDNIRNSSVSKLNAEKAATIKSLIALGCTYEKAGEAFGVTYSTAYEIWVGDIWGDVTETELSKEKALGLFNGTMLPKKTGTHKLSKLHVSVVKSLLYLGFKQATLARATGVSQSSISLINSSKHWPEVKPMPLAFLYARVFNLNREVKQW